jgi:hypothetical protein
MIKTAIILIITLVLIYFGLGFISEDINIPRQDIFSWTGIIFLAYLFERIIKYFLQLPFKTYFEELRQHPLAKAVQDGGFTLSYIFIWLAIGITPINAAVAGNLPQHLITNLVFLKISIVLIIATLVFSILWWLTLKLKK